jgi:Family of unknown function (DUF1028)
MKYQASVQIRSAVTMESHNPAVSWPLVHTYSIVARDAETGQLGVAVGSHYFAVGSVVTWAEAGVGAVATQSLADPAYGKLGLDLMRAGRSAPIPWPVWSRAIG